MSGIHKSDRNTIGYDLFFHVPASHKALHHALGVFYGIHRYILFFTCSSSLTVAPFCLEHLDMGTVTQHNITQLLRGLRRKNLSAKAFLI